MFDLTSSKLLILGIVALIVVGPKELPFLLRTIGKYVAMIRRQANEFRAQFDEAMREAELDSIRKDVENVARDAETSLRDVGQSVDREIQESERAIEQSSSAAHSAAETPPTHTFDPLNGLDATHSTTHTAVSTPAIEPVDGTLAGTPLPHADHAMPEPALAKAGT